MGEQNEMTATIFDIQRFCIHDGPGIRTTVFFKGCNMRCFWCHNPESYKAHSELSLFPDRCIGCGKCLAACARKCHSADSEGKRTFDRESCVRCGACTNTCYAGSLVMTGKSYTVGEVMKVVSSDAPFYENSNGGMTCSGGEPLLQSEFVCELMRASKAVGIDTALDTAGNVGYDSFERVLPYTDLILYDVKCIDSDLHQRVTGSKNALILENLRRLAAEAIIPIWIRIPVIPGVNDNIDNMRATAEFLAELPGAKLGGAGELSEKPGGAGLSGAKPGGSGIVKVELLPYHGLGAGKYESLGMKKIERDAILKPPDRNALLELARAFEGAAYEVAVS